MAGKIKLNFLIIEIALVSLFLLSCSNSSKENSEGDISLQTDISSQCPNYRTDTAGTSITTTIRNNESKMIFREITNINGGSEEFYFNGHSSGKLNLKIIRKDTISYYCILDHKSSDFHTSYYSGQAIFEEYLVGFERDAKINMCEKGKISDSLKLDTEISNYFAENFSFNLTNNEKFNLFFYLNIHCSSPY